MVTVGGRLSDVFGRRYFMIAGACIASVGAVVGATSTSITQMIASGTLFGIGGGLQGSHFPQSMGPKIQLIDSVTEMAFACVQEIVPNHYRILAIGVFESTALLAFVSPCIAYTMIATTALGWRTVYWFLFAFEACGLALVVLFYKPPAFHTKHRADGKSRMQLVREMDFVGFFLFAAGCVCFLIGVNWVSTTWVVGTATARSLHTKASSGRKTVRLVERSCHINHRDRRCVTHCSWAVGIVCRPQVPNAATCALPECARLHDGPRDLLRWRHALLLNVSQTSHYFTQVLPTIDQHQATSSMAA